MRDVTLCFLIKDGHACLAMKKRGFGEGKWNGVGGKVAEGERIEEAALRELKEEIGVTAREESLEQVAVIEFSFAGKPDWSQRMHVFLIRAWEGEPTESEEMAPAWYRFEEIPYDAMWVDDRYWLPQVLRGETIKGSFGFTEDGSRIISQELGPLA